MFWNLLLVSRNTQLSKQEGHEFAARGIRFESCSPMMSCGTLNSSLGFKAYSPTRLRPGAGKRGCPTGALILEGCRHHQLKKTGAQEKYFDLPSSALQSPTGVFH